MRFAQLSLSFSPLHFLSKQPGTMAGVMVGERVGLGEGMVLGLGERGIDIQLDSALAVVEHPGSFTAVTVQSYFLPA